jgi:hypothetical protein
MSRPSASTLARFETSGATRATEVMVRIEVSSGPKRRLKAICSSSPRLWPRKSSTECSSKASTISANTRSLT